MKNIGLAILLGLSTTCLEGATLRAKANLRILAQPKKEASALKTMKTGETITGDRVGMYWKVKVDKKDGFISFKDVTLKAEPSDPSFAAKLRQSSVQTQISESDPAVSRGRSSVMGVRGLEDEGEVNNIIK